jgi:hypothetical protein
MEVQKPCGAAGSSSLKAGPNNTVAVIYKCFYSEYVMVIFRSLAVRETPQVTAFMKRFTGY